ncbi:hypothetical protein TWF694_004747 [Orbilia ellipsospora]|uniref:Uncharacterized protein n=1 Tax=Orbilia ellipsospora TaxID=2528407 RepID=A0AAV9WXG4_9PEZI
MDRDDRIQPWKEVFANLKFPENPAPVALTVKDITNAGNGSTGGGGSKVPKDRYRDWTHILNQEGIVRPKAA